MAIKRKLIECQCGEIYADSPKLIDVIFGVWKLKDVRKKTGKEDEKDIIIASFQRKVFCSKCSQELIKENRLYELTPPNSESDESVSFQSTREFVFE